MRGHPAGVFFIVVLRGWVTRGRIVYHIVNHLGTAHFAGCASQIEPSVEGDLEPELVAHVEERFGVAPRVVDWMMRMTRLAKVLERLERVTHEPLVKRAEVLRAEAEEIFAEEMV